MPENSKETEIYGCEIQEILSLVWGSMTNNRGFSNG
jgi:hypothetical protein